jgi:ATP-binding cassette subfamily B (MDR/TAP) protein 1
MLITRSQIRELQLAVSQPLGLLLLEIVGTVSSLGIAFFYSWKLSLVIIGTFPFATAVLYFISSGLGPAVEAQKRELSRASKYANTAVSAISTVKAFNAQEHEVWQYHSTIKKVTTHYLRQARSNALQFGVTKFLLVFLFVVGFWFGLYLVNHGLQPGNVLITFYSCLGAFLAVETVLPQLPVLVKGMSAGERLKAMMDEMHVGKSSATGGSEKPASCPGDIEINEVSTNPFTILALLIRLGLVCISVQRRHAGIG